MYETEHAASAGVRHLSQLNIQNVEIVRFAPALLPSKLLVKGTALHMFYSNANVGKFEYEF